MTDAVARLDPFFAVVCDYREGMVLGLTALVFLCLLSVFGLVLSPADSGARLISYVNVAIVLVTGAGVGGLYWTCLRRCT